MMGMSSLVARFAALRRNDQGVAAVEFALIVPFLIVLYLGSMEAASLFTVDKRVSSVAATIGDLVSQWDPDDGTMPVADLTDYMNASTGILAPYSTTGLKIVVTLVQVKNDGTTKVLWSRANAAGTVKTTGHQYAGLGATTEMNLVARGGCVVAAEASYSHLPLLGQVFETAVPLKHTNYFMPRFGSSVPISVGTALAIAACTSQT